MTNQEQFDTVVKHLRNQGCKAVNSEDSSQCYYRTENGLKCALGALIRDEDYTPAMEIFPNNSIHVEGSIIREYVNKMGFNFSLLNNLQCTHDNNNIEDWESRFSDIARKFNLIYTPKA